MDRAFSENIYHLFSAGATIDECTTLHERWRQYHRQWFFSSLAESEQKMSQAEDIFRRTKNNFVQSQSNDESYSHRKLRCQSLFYT